MDTIRQITNDLAIAGQPSVDQLSQLAEAGYRTVVNLRSPQEIGSLESEQQKVECLGLHYVNIPISNRLNLDDALLAIQQLNDLPRPILIHCDSGIRSSILALMQLSINQGVKAEAAFQRVITLGLLSD